MFAGFIEPEKLWCFDWLVVWEACDTNVADGLSFEARARVLMVWSKVKDADWLVSTEARPIHLPGRRLSLRLLTLSLVGCWGKFKVRYETLTAHSSSGRCRPHVMCLLFPGRAFVTFHRFFFAMRHLTAGD